MNISRYTLISLLFLLSAPASHAADLYPVAGTILNAATNSPLPSARVNFYRAQKPVASAITGSDGRFRFELPAGTYVMAAGTRDVQEKYGSRHGDNPLGSAVIAGPGKDTDNLVFRFFPTSAISGRVVDDAGEPVTDALVQLIQSGMSMGHSTTALFRLTRTNDLGEYRLDHLPGGVRYFLAVTAEPWFTARNTLSSSGLSGAYAPVYYPDTGEASKAAALIPKPGEEARADFTLRTVANATVTVKFDAPADARGTVALVYDGIGGTDAIQQTISVAPGARTHVLSGVPPGRYNLRVTIYTGNWVLRATKTVEVNGTDVPVEIALKPNGRIEGTVKMETGGQLPTGMVVRIRLESWPQPMASAPVKPDGSFVFPPATPGRFLLFITGPDGVYASRITSSGAILSDGFIQLSEGDDISLSITASTKVGRVRGFVMDGEHPMEGALVVMDPIGEQPVGAYPHSYQTESDGSFDFRTLPAGRYRIFAADDTNLEYANSAIVAPYLAAAKEIEVQPGGVIEQRLIFPPSGGR